MATNEPGASGHEPGLDLHEWETQWQQLRDLAEDDPAQTLPELVDFVEAILTQQGFRPDLPDLGGQSPDVVGGYRFAREVADGVERGDGAVGPGDVAAAYEALTELYGHLTDHLLD